MSSYAPYAGVSTEELGNMVGTTLKKFQRAELQSRAENGDHKAQEILTDARARASAMRKRRAKKAKRKNVPEDDYDEEAVHIDSRLKTQNKQHNEDVTTAKRTLRSASKPHNDEQIPKAVDSRVQEASIGQSDKDAKYVTAYGTPLAKSASVEDRASQKDREPPRSLEDDRRADIDQWLMDIEQDDEEQPSNAVDKDDQLRKTLQRSSEIGQDSGSANQNPRNRINERMENKVADRTSHARTKKSLYWRLLEQGGTSVERAGTPQRHLRK